MLNFQLWRHMGHCLFNGCRFSHLTMQCMWKQWEQTPHTSGQSSPGSAHSGQVLSKDMRQIPQFSSFAIQRQVATPVHDLIVTFILRTFAYTAIVPLAGVVPLRCIDIVVTRCSCFFRGSFSRVFAKYCLFS